MSLNGLTPTSRRPAHPFRRLLAGATLLAISFEIAAHADNGPCEIVFGQSAPDRHQALQIQVFDTNSNSSASTSEGVVVYGFAPTLQYAHPMLNRVKPVMDLVAGESTAAVTVAKAVSGSTARLALMGSAHDIDLEAAIILNETQPSPGTVESLFQANSPRIRTLKNYLVQHVRSRLKSNPEIRFLELKAGTFLNPDSGLREGLKWNLDSLLAGSQKVVEPSRTREVTLDMALTEDARIKMDWAVPSPFQEGQIGNVPPQYIEASVLYRIGVKTGNNQPRLRIGTTGTPLESLPFRITTVALSKEDFTILRDLSTGIRNKPLEETHQSIQLGEDKTPGDVAKRLKRVFSLLQFWESIDDYNILTGRALTKTETLHEILEILTNPEIRKLGELKSQGQLISVTEQKSITLPGTFAQDWKARARSAIQNESIISTADLVDALTAHMNKLLTAALAKKPLTQGFVDFVIGRHKFMRGALTQTSQYVAITPNAATQVWLQRLLTAWEKKYDRIKFNDLDQLHVTLHFLGKTTPSTRHAVDHPLSALPTTWTFDTPGLRILGRNQDLIGIAFSPTLEQSRAVELFRAKSYMAGARPETNYREFLPHVTLGRFDSRDPVALKQVNDLMTDVALQKEQFVSDIPPRILKTANKAEISEEDTK